MGMMDGMLSRDPKRDVDGGGGGGGDGGGKSEGRGGGDPMEIDSRGNARGQTEEMIRAQERKVRETARGLWSGR